MCKNSGFCGSIIRVLLTVINITFFVLGAAIFTVAAIVKWDKGSKITSEISSIIDITAFEDLAVALLILGGAIMIVSIVGLIGACCSNRVFLVVYEIVLILLFIAHIVIVIIVVVEAPAIEKEFRKQLNNSVTLVKEEEKKPSPQIKEVCKELKLVSDIFKCCGYNDSSDYLLPPTRLECCVDVTQPGCADKVVKTFNDEAVNIIIIPNAVVLALELIFIIAVPFLIGRITKAKKKEKYTPTYGDKNVTFQYNM